MNGAEEVNMGTNGIVLNMKESSRSKMKAMEDEHVSNAHSTKHDNIGNALPMCIVHVNNSIKVQSERQVQQIKELVNSLTRQIKHPRL